MVVSVLLPVYNAGFPLAQAIESILNQDLAAFELLIIDDASTDSSAQTIRNYAAQDPRIKAIFHSQNVGLANTLNEGLQLATYGFVARMDQDDESLPNRLRVQFDYLNANPDVMVLGSFVYHMGAKPEFDRLIELPIAPADIKAVLTKYNCMYHPSVMLRRKEILELGGYRSQFKNAEDYDLWLRVSKVHILANVPVPLLRYRFSVTGMTLSRKWEQLFYVYLALAAFEDEASPLEELKERATTMLKQMDQTYFLTQVAKGTVKDLISLRLWKDALAVAFRFSKDIGAWRSLALLLNKLVSRFSSVTERIG